MWHELTYQSPNFNGATVEVWQWISNFTPHFIGHAYNNSIPHEICMKFAVLFLLLRIGTGRFYPYHSASPCYECSYANESDMKYMIKWIQWELIQRSKSRQNRYLREIISIYPSYCWYIADSFWYWCTWMEGYIHLNIIRVNMKAQTMFADNILKRSCVYNTYNKAEHRTLRYPIFRNVYVQFVFKSNVSCSKRVI